MKLLSCQESIPAAPVRIGAVAVDGRWIDLNRAYRRVLEGRGSSPAAARRIADALLPGDMVAYIDGGGASRAAAEEALAWAADRDAADVVIVQAAVRLLPPVPRPPMLRDFMAFETHLRNIYPKLGREIPPEWYQLPVYYKGNPGSLGAHGADVPIPHYATELDYEFELGFVIGRPGRDIPRDRARDHIYGMTIYNDFSARAIQSQEMAVGLGPAKGKDFTGGHVFGPYLVTMDEIDDPYGLRMRAWVNDELVCDDSSGTIHWRFEEMIAHASQAEDLVVGEVFGSGTVGNGSGGERGVALHPGDRVRLEVTHLGTLENTVTAPPD